jgi:predicted nucleic acid-binding protein
MEIIKGARNKVELNNLKNFLNVLEIVRIDKTISQKAEHLIETYHLSHNLQIADALIAATCLIKGAILWTLNKKDFVFIKGINFFEPV